MLDKMTAAKSWLGLDMPSMASECKHRLLPQNLKKGLGQNDSYKCICALSESNTALSKRKARCARRREAGRRRGW